MQSRSQFDAGHLSAADALQPAAPSLKAALHYILSGTGANTIDGKREARGPGSLVYEPFGLVHQWGNAGDASLTFLAFNIILAGAPARPQQRIATAAIEGN